MRRIVTGTSYCVLYLAFWPLVLITKWVDKNSWVLDDVTVMVFVSIVPIVLTLLWWLCLTILAVRCLHA